MSLLRWLVFLPVGLALVALVQLALVSFAEAVYFWLSAPVILFFGVVPAFCGGVPVYIAPRGRIGAAAFLTVFLLAEAISLLSVVPSWPIYPLVVRLYADAAVVVGALALSGHE